MDDISVDVPNHEDSSDNLELVRLVAQFSEKLGDYHPLVKLLKVTCCQNILSPVWLWIKFNLLSKFPFKDEKLGWHVQVTFREERVIVVHQKTEQAKDDPSHVGDPTFVFQWELQLIFTIDMKKFLDSSFAITNLVFSSKMDGSKYKKFKKLIGDWQETSTVFMQEDRFPRCSPSISRKRSAKKSRSRNPSPKAARKKEIPQKKGKNWKFP